MFPKIEPVHDLTSSCCFLPSRTSFSHLPLRSCRYYDYHVTKISTRNLGANDHGVWPNIIMHKSRLLRHGRLHRFQPNGFRHISWLALAIVTVLGDDVEDELVSIGSLLALQRHSVFKSQVNFRRHSDKVRKTSTR